MSLIPVDELLAELERRRRPKKPATPIPPPEALQRLIADLHPKQRAFVCDPARRKAALCSRRAGKSWGIAVWLLEGGYSDPGGLSVYIVRSKGDARRILWDETLRVISERYELNLWLREIDNQLMVVLPNGHKIWLAGCKDSSEMGKFRGPKYRRAVIDEAQEFAFLGELVRASIRPALIDKHGELCVAGTPSPIPAGLFYVATTGDGGEKWSSHHWTIRDNPYLTQVEEELAEELKHYGGDATHPTFRREWLGEWVRDEGALVYPYNGQINAWNAKELPHGEYQYAIGVDLGVTDSTAIVVACCRRGHPEVYVVDVWKREGLIPSTVAAHVERYLRDYPKSICVVDEGGLGKGYAEEMRRTYGLPVQPAEKSKKRAYQELVAGDLSAGVIKLDPRAARLLLDEIQILQWRPDRTEEDPKFENHAADAFLYAVRALRPFYRPELEEPKPGTEEWQRREWERERQDAMNRAKKRSSRWRGEADLHLPLAA